MDKRHLKRIALLEKLFGLGFRGITPDKIVKDDETLAAIVDKLAQIDTYIIQYAPRYPIENIGRVDLAVLRLSIYELIYKKEQPEKVIIDEAVQLAKEFGSDKSYSFVNGVLGSILKAEK